MHFLFFTINLLSWTIMGLLIGKLTLQGQRRREIKTVFLATLAAILGGAFSFATHGMWVGLGIDFFNLFVASATGITIVYAFVPERREAISLLFANGVNFIKASLTKTQEVSQAQFGREFWRNITSTLSS